MASSPTDKGKIKGYGHPPAEYQFKKGRSGNPKGRPKGAKNKKVDSLGTEPLRRLFLEEAYRQIPIQDGGRSITMPMAQAIVRSMSVAAAKGQVRAQKFFLQSLFTIEQSDYELQRDHNRALIDYKIEWMEEIEAARKAGRPIPKPPLDIDDIYINFVTGEVALVPLGSERRKKIDKLRAIKKNLIEAIEENKEEMKTADCGYKKFLEMDNEFNESNLKLLSQFW